MYFTKKSSQYIISISYINIIILGTFNGRFRSPGNQLDSTTEIFVEELLVVLVQLSAAEVVATRSCCRHENNVLTDDAFELLLDVVSYLFLVGHPFGLNVVPDLDVLLVLLDSLHSLSADNFVVERRLAVPGDGSWSVFG